MSRIGQKPITLPDGVDVKVDGGQVSVKGPLGQLHWSLTPGIHVKVEDGVVVLTRTGKLSKIKGRAWTD